MSDTGARHRRPARAAIPPADAPHQAAGRAAAPSRHRQQRQETSGLWRRPRRIALVTGVLVAAGTLSAAAAVYLPGRPATAASTRPDAYSRQVTGALVTGVADAMSQLPASPEPSATPSTASGADAGKAARAAAVAARHRRVRRKPSKPKPAPAPAPVYLNPLRAVSALMPQRIDMGVDFAGAGPVYAIGDAIVTSATGDSAGWPGGGWITYQLTSGPGAGLVVYVAEDVTPAVQVGEHVTASTVVANMYNGGDGIETGWAMPDSASAESQLPVAGGISGGGPFPTWVGTNFDQLLVALGVPAASNAGSAPSGLLPSNYPADWSRLV